MTKRYELSDQRWVLVGDIGSPPQRMGRPRRDDREGLSGLFWPIAARCHRLQ